MRVLEDWLDSYLKYVDDTEPAKIFHKWVGLTIIAGALRKKVSLGLGRINVYPNMYVVLVAEPGIARKSQAIDFGHDIMTQIPEIVVSADATTKEALLDDLEEYAVDEQLLDGTPLRHASLSVISREFESFLGQKKENTKMLVLLTDLFDCKEIPWKYRTKHSGTNAIPSIFLNLLAATTPDSLASCLPTTAIGGGLTSRMIFVWAEKKHKKVPRPSKSPEVLHLRDLLIKDLYLISRIVGQYQFSPACIKEWENVYMHYEELDNSRLCKAPSFNGWYSRKPMYILKVTQCVVAAKNSNLIVEWKDIQKAISLIEEVEYLMGRAFKAVGRSLVANEVDLVMTLVKNYKYISEKDLMNMVWKDIDSTKFDNVISTAIRQGNVKRMYKGPAGEGGIWYANAEWLSTQNNRNVKN